MEYSTRDSDATIEQLPWTKSMCNEVGVGRAEVITSTLVESNWTVSPLSPKYSRWSRVGS